MISQVKPILTRGSRQETLTVCTGNESVSLDQANSAHKSMGKCFIEDHVTPADIEGIKLDLALMI